LPSCFICLFCRHIIGTPQLIKKWETDSGLKVPESVLFDSGNRVLYVSNIDGTDPWGKDGERIVGKLETDGKKSRWTGSVAWNAQRVWADKGKLYVGDPRAMWL